MLLYRLVSCSVSTLLLTAVVPTWLHAATILGIDINGDIHSISTDDGSHTLLGSTGLPSAHTLDRSSNGNLYTFSRAGDNDVHLISEVDYSSTSIVATGSTITGGEGGLAFTSDSMAYATTRAPGINPLLLQLDLNAGTLVGSALLDIQSDISSLTLRDDGMLIGIAGQSSELLQINPSTAEISVIANLSGLTILGGGGLAQIDGTAYFANSLLFGSTTEVWSVDLYTGAHSLATTVNGLGGITGIAAIPEPGTALMIGLGLALLGARRSKGRFVIAALVFPIAMTSGAVVEAGEIEDLLGEFCDAGLLGESECVELMACLEDPSTCSGAGGSGPAGFSAASAAGGGGAAMMMGPVTGASIEFRVHNSENPRLSPSALWVAFDETNGPRRTHRAVFGDGVPGGTQAPSPSPFGAHSTTLGGIDDGGLIVGSRGQISAPVSRSYIADASIGVFFTLTDNFNNTFDLSSGFDVDFNSSRAAGSVYDANVGVFGKNYPAFWDFNAGSGQYELRRFNGLTASTTWSEGAFKALTPAGTFAVGYSGSGSVPSPFGHQAFLYTASGSTFTGLPFIPSATTNFSEAKALSDATDIIIGTATNASGNNVATAWFDFGGSYFVQELPVFWSATTSQGLAVSGDGLSIGGSVGSEAAVWNGLTFEARPLADYVLGMGLTVPPECTLKNVTDMDFAGLRLVGEATCDTGSGPFTRVYELETPVSVPEPGLGAGLLPGIAALAFLDCWRSRKTVEI